MIRLAVIAALSACLLTSLACGDDNDGASSGDDATPAPGAVSLAEFFKELQGFSDDANAGIDELGVKYPDTFISDVQQTKDSYAEYVRIFEEYGSDRPDLVGPPEVQARWEESGDIDEQMNAIHHQRLDRLQDATMMDDVNEIFGPDEEYDSLVARNTEICIELEEIAQDNDNDIDYDVPCGE